MTREEIGNMLDAINKGKHNKNFVEIYQILEMIQTELNNVKSNLAPDLTTYLKSADADTKFALKTHAHSISDVTNLQSALDGKAATNHTHTIANITGLQTAIDSKSDKTYVDDTFLKKTDQVNVDLTAYQKTVDADNKYIIKSNFSKEYIYSSNNDLFLKPPAGVNYDDFANALNDKFYSGITAKNKISDGDIISVEAGGYFFYKIDTTNFTKNSFNAMVEVLENNTNLKVEYRVLDREATTATLVPFVKSEDSYIYKTGEVPITKGQYIEIRFDNRTGTTVARLNKPVVFEGGTPYTSNYEQKRQEYFNLNIDTQIDNTLSSINTDLESFKTEISNDAIKVTTPVNFLWNTHPLINKVTTDGKGLFNINYDVSTNKHIGGKTVYVDPVNGRDGNDGLSETTPVMTVKYAETLLNNGDTLVFLEGDYYRTNGVLITAPFTKSVNLIGKGKVRLIMGDKPVWTKTSSYNNVYEFTRSSVKRLVDFNKLIEGLPQEYKLVASIAEVDTIPDSFYTDNIKVYVNTGGIPNEKVIPLMTSRNTYIANNTGNVYIENIEFHGGGSVLRAEMTPQNNLYLKDVMLNCSTQTNGNGLEIVGGNTVISQNVQAHNNWMDGFNYHVGLDGSKPNIIEINCKAFENGYEKGTAGVKSNNGSTIHDGLKGIRLNGFYGRNDGGNIADVNEGTQSWNLGCVAYESYQGKDFQASSGAYLWLDNCIAFGSTNSINVGDTTSKIYVRFGKYQNELNVGERLVY